MTTTEGRVNGRQIRHRVCARVLPVNPQGEVLLLHGWNPAAPQEPYWFDIGGAIDPGETLVEAAGREPIAREDAGFDWGVWRLLQDQTYFALAHDHDPAANVRLPDIMRTAVQIVRGTP